MKKTAVLVRHGQTVFNEKKRIQGWTDSPLTESGKEQARRAGEYIKKKGWNFDHVYSSTSERCCDTTELMTDLPYARLKGLKEWNFGKYDGEPEYLNPPLAEYSEFFKAAGGESREEVIERMVHTVQSVMDQEDHECVLFVSHGAAVRNFQKQAKDPFHLNESIPRLFNGAVLVFEYDADTKEFTFTDIFNEPA